MDRRDRPVSGASRAAGFVAAAPAPLPRLTTRWLAMALAALLSLTFQSLVVQTHVHVERDVASARSHPTVSSFQAAHHRAPADTPLDCPKCRQLAQAGAYLLPLAIALPLAGLTFVWLHEALAAPRAARSRSHAWQSRAPPTGNDTSHQ